MGVIGNLINKIGCDTIKVNGVENHVHCFFALKPSISVSEVMKDVKAKSSKWINDNQLAKNHFEWQKGYGCFSYGHSQIDHVYQYLENQEQHHKKMSFREEYIQLLEKFEIDFDMRYIFHPPK